MIDGLYIRERSAFWINRVDLDKLHDSVEASRPGLRSAIRSPTLRQSPREEPFATVSTPPYAISVEAKCIESGPRQGVSVYVRRLFDMLVTSIEGDQPLLSMSFFHLFLRIHLDGILAALGFNP